ncbi:uncharacterized protein LOC121764531 [Salvia splendens]|uniref:uncharacterized protein LOC121764531 n=1 Tax=Salvia splendens TaxID=180675 RepID=UPI001C268EE0|nr:uncharacterized protein LOC121764531 [Salvia splendens]
MQMIYLHLIFFFFALLRPLPSSPSPYHKPNCPDRCGNVTIPYPFGVGSGCSLGYSFNITCNTSTTPPKPYLNIKKYNLEVVEIRADNPTRIRIRYPYLIYGVCYNLTSGNKTWREENYIDLSETQYTLSENNWLTTIGCDDFPAVTTNRGQEYYLDACVGFCSRNRSTVGVCPNNDDSNSVGEGCCRVPIAKGTWFLYMGLDDLTKIVNRTRLFPCSYGFVKEKGSIKKPAYEYDLSILRQQQTSKKSQWPQVVSLDWRIGDQNCSRARLNSTYACQANSHCVDFCAETSGYLCNCSQGYTGNPYLYQGCTDINECDDNPCGPHSQCKNVPGSFSCTCDSGYNGDGKKGESGCTNTIKFVLIGLGSALGLLQLLLLCFWLRKVFEKRKNRKRKEDLFKHLLLLQKQTGEGSFGRTKLFTAKELEKATDHFNKSRICGRGGQGIVYKGMLSDGTIVAIKKLNKVDENQLEQFINEVLILSQINHKNVVKLLGCCLATKDPLLVYEFLPNGTLFDFIHDPKPEFPLTWNIRLKIATDVSGALAYLHSASSVPIYHRDIKSTNILLDEKYIVKVSDFGISKLVEVDQTHLTTLVKGTFGYLDPEYYQTSQYTEKSDVYSFGVVLLELLTGQRPISMERTEMRRNLASHFLAYIGADNLDAILDAQVLEEGRKDEVIAVARLARRCLNVRGQMRPTMKEESLVMSQTHPANDMELEEEAIVSEAKDMEYSWTSHDHCISTSSSDAHPLMSIFLSPQQIQHTTTLGKGIQMQMIYLHLIFFFFALLRPLPSSPIPYHKPGCPARCGNVTIPYPFGIGPRCSLEPSFNITCNTSTTPPKPYLSLNASRVNLEVVEIRSDDPSRIRIRYPYLLYGVCYNLASGNGTWRYRRGINLSKTQYTLSENNWLIAVGCDDFGETITFRGQESFLDPGHLDACVGFCSGNRSAVGVCPNNDDSNSVGEGCCRVPMAKGTWYLSIGLFDLTKIVNRKRLFPCSYAFVKEKGIINKPTYTYDSSILQQSSAAFSQKNQWQQVVSLDWRIGDRNCSRARRNSTYACQANSHCVDFGADIEGYLCNCSHGYVGNPYLYPGCTDINECDDNPCAPHAQCKNVPGSFSCTCDSGYNGDGKKGGSGCTSSIKFVLIGLGSALGLLLLILLCFYMRKVFEKRKNRKRKEDLFKHLLLLQKQTGEGSFGRTKLFTAKELEKATDHFNKSRICGRGGQGIVYKGMLSDGAIVAIKKLNKVDENQLEQFINEVLILSQINHKNVVKLLGCCLATQDPLLVYEFLPNGTLFDFIHDPKPEFPLTWNMRLKIATDVAGALAYLHSASSVPIYHRDIKSTNILLDEKYIVKVSDFGISKLAEADQTHLTTLVKGTFGYLDPEYYQTSQYTEKSDVYSFGVVLLELLTGQRPISMERTEMRRNLASHFLAYIGADNLDAILDAQVLEEGRKDEVIAVARLARRCLNVRGQMRPTMKEVAMELESLVLSQSHPANDMELEEEAIVSEAKDVEFSDIEYSWTSHDHGIASSSSDAHPLMSKD